MTASRSTSVDVDVPDATILDWIEDAAGFLDAMDDSYEFGDPVPRGEVVEQAVAAGYSKAEAKAAMRDGVNGVVFDMDDATFAAPSRGIGATDDATDAAGSADSATTTNEATDTHATTDADSADPGGDAGLLAGIDGYPSLADLVDDEYADAIREANTVNGTAHIPKPLPADAEFWDDLLAEVLPDSVEYGPNGYPVVQSSSDFYPDAIKARDIWTPWAKIDGAKQPVSPERDGKPTLWRFDDRPDHQRPERSFDAVQNWTEAPQDLINSANARPKKLVRYHNGDRIDSDREAELHDAGRRDEIQTETEVVADRPRTGIILQDRSRPPEDRLVLVDWDDVRDSETGEVHPFVAFWLYAVDCYAEISQSGEGIHQYVYGEVPGANQKHLGDFDVEFTLSNGRRDATEPAVVDDDSNKPSDLATAEVYDGKRVSGMTGRHVDGTGSDVVEAIDALEAIADDTGLFWTPDTTDAASTSASASTITPGSYQGGSLDQLDADRDDVDMVRYEAIIEARHGEWTNEANWKLIGMAAFAGIHAGLDAQTIIDDLPDYERSRNASEVMKVARKHDSDSAQPPRLSKLVDAGILPDDHGLSENITFDVPEAADDSRFVTQCAPPADTGSEVDVQQARATIRTDLYEAARDADSLAIDSHPAGVGKTTNYSLGAADSDDSHVMLLPSHENCREFQTDSAKPNGYYHLKGASQPQQDGCMDAALKHDTHCPTHDHQSQCPTMCGAYQHLNEEEFTQFKRLSAAVGVREAHHILGLEDRPWHGTGDTDRCKWQQQFSTVENKDRVVTVHDYANLASVQNKDLVMVDDLQGTFETEREFDSSDIGNLKDRFNDLAETAGIQGPEFLKLREYCDRLRDAATCGDNDTTLAQLDAPTIQTPDGVTHPDHDAHDTAVALSNIARTYYHATYQRLTRGNWTGEPLDLTPLFACLAESGLSQWACRVAARQPFILDQCPEDDTHAPLATGDAGQLYCPDCQWTEDDGYVGHEHTQHPARIAASIATDQNGSPKHVAARQIPITKTLPDPSNVLVLDATPQPRILKLLFGATTVHHLDQHRNYQLPNARVTQITDGAYHRSTITNDNSTTSTRMNNAINKIASVHDKVLVVGAQAVLNILDLPDNTVTRHYGALRGLNHKDCDAAVLVGANHPDETQMQDTVEMLAAGTDAHVGGTEYGLRDGADFDAIHRKYRYEDDTGNGYAARTKAYSGLVGDKFQSVREDELEQAAHRIRPVLATEDDTSEIFLLTNVPTQLPIDTLTTLAAIDDPLQASLGVRGRTSEFVQAVAESVNLAEFTGSRSDWEDAAGDITDEVSDREVRNWMKDLRDNDNVVQDGYTSSGAPAYTATSELAELF